jgi:arylsulfatase A-like enzyme
MAGLLMKKTIVALTALVLSASAFAEQQPSMPNIILMMADDLGYGDTGFNGNKIIKTPSLDLMAKQGAVMTNFHAGGPVCSPTRGTYLTGRHYFRYGIYSANTGHLPKQEITIAEILKEKGYNTGHFGKWHLGTLSKTVSAKGAKRKPKENYSPPAWHGYDTSFVTESAVSTWDPTIGSRAKNNPFYLNGIALDPTEPLLQGGAAKVVMDKALAHIKTSVSEKTPFFTVIWFHAPHAPVVAGPEYLKMYPGYGKAAHYYGAITEMDDQIGRLRDTLTSLGVSDNTLITFTSDNGPEGKKEADKNPGVTAGLKGRKRSLYEGGVRVPSLALWPGHIKASSIIAEPSSTLDYLPTIAELVNYQLPDNRPIDGTSLQPLFEEKAFKRAQPIPFRTKNAFAFIDGNYKLVGKDNDKQALQLFDIEKDAKEQYDIAAANPERVSAMHKKFLKFNNSAQHSQQGGDYDDDEFTPVGKWIPLKTK